MPRIEIIPVNWENSKEKKAGDGTPTLDICGLCNTASYIKEGQVIDPLFPDAFVEHNGATIGCTEVEHPCYDEDTYHCAICDRVLLPEDD